MSQVELAPSGFPGSELFIQRRLQGSTCCCFSSGELALTNFDTQRLEEITNRGIRISSNQATPPPTIPHQTLMISPSCYSDCAFDVCHAGSVLRDWPATCSEDGAVLSGQQHSASHVRHSGWDPALSLFTSSRYVLMFLSFAVLKYTNISPVERLQRFASGLLM